MFLFSFISFFRERKSRLLQKTAKDIQEPFPREETIFSNFPMGKKSTGLLVRLLLEANVRKSNKRKFSYHLVAMIEFSEAVVMITAGEGNGV